MAKTYDWGTGRRKASVARVRITPGKGDIIVNGKKLGEYFSLDSLCNDAVAPMIATDTRTKFDVFVNVHGGGTTGQAGAIRLGIARALMVNEEGHRSALREEGLVTRDPRRVERKKFGLRKARRSRQFSKR